MRLGHSILVALFAGLPACAGHEAMMSDRAQVFEEHVDAYQAELDAHEREVSSA